MGRGPAPRQGGSITLTHGVDRLAGGRKGDAVHEDSGYVRALDPRVRVVAAVLFAVLVVALADFGALGAALLLALTAMVAARLPLGHTVKQVLTVDTFVLVMVLMLPFTTPGEEVFRLWNLPASREGLTKAAEIALKTNAVMLMMLALVGTLETPVLGRALKHLRLPDGLVHLLLFTVRYIEVLQREYGRLRLAMRARAFRAGSNRHTWRSVGYLVGMLLVKSFERSERILMAMKCRGFDGRLHLLDDMVLGKPDAVFTSLAVPAGAVLVVLELV